jgi:hypothetical protein
VWLVKIELSFSTSRRRYPNGPNFARTRWGEAPAEPIFSAERQTNESERIERELPHAFLYSRTSAHNQSNRMFLPICREMLIQPFLADLDLPRSAAVSDAAATKTSNQRVLLHTVCIPSAAAETAALRGKGRICHNAATYTNNSHYFALIVSYKIVRNIHRRSYRRTIL